MQLIFDSEYVPWPIARVGKNKIKCLSAGGLKFFAAFCWLSRE
jgi:hypothetical protein